MLLDEQDEVIVRSTIDLGHNLGLVVVAEGVENNEVLERLRELGCDVAQGLLHLASAGARPLPVLARNDRASEPSSGPPRLLPLDRHRPGTWRDPDPALD